MYEKTQTDRGAVSIERRGQNLVATAQVNASRLRELAQGLECLADRTVGPRPTPIGEKKDQPPIAGNFEAMLSAANTDSASLLDECNRSLRLLEEFI